MCMQCMVLCDGRGICDFFALKVTQNKGRSKVIISLLFHFIVAMAWPKSVKLHELQNCNQIQISKCPLFPSFSAN